MWVHPLTKADPAQKKLAAIGKKIGALEQQAQRIRAKAPKARIADYALMRADGSKVKLSELFGASDKLVLVHNMGKTCRRLQRALEARRRQGGVRARQQ
jgi:predicted dithiol-disulfide oxidoreductase (DUF899 family)